jgi:hypothetical protein
VEMTVCWKSMLTMGVPTNVATEGVVAYDPAPNVLYSCGASGWASV